MGRTGENNMSKYCRPMGLYVTYLDCMECEDKECKAGKENVTVIEKFKNIESMMDYLKSINLKNETILNNLIKAYYIINNESYENIFCSISGGADSDVLLDICYRCDIGNKCRYVYFDTGLEYEATKRHISYLEQKYGISIERESNNTYTSMCKKVWRAISV